MIGHNIKLTVLDARGNQVRVGIDAPPDVPVDREEIFERKERERNADKATDQTRAGKTRDPEAVFG